MNIGSQQTQSRGRNTGGRTNTSAGADHKMHPLIPVLFFLGARGKGGEEPAAARAPAGGVGVLVIHGGPWVLSEGGRRPTC